MSPLMMISRKLSLFGCFDASDSLSAMSLNILSSSTATAALVRLNGLSPWF